MSQRSRFRGPFDKQPSKSAQVILKSTPQYLYHIDWSWQSQLSWKKSLLLPWIRRRFPQATWHTCSSTVEICITASLLYSLITAKSIVLEKSLLLTCKFLGLLVNTLAGDKGYPVLNRDNLTIPIQMQVSGKEKTFSHFLAAFLKSTWNFRYFEEGDGPHRLCIFRITELENVVR